MKLIGSLTSPYVRKVRVVMAEKKLDFQLVLEDVWASDAIQRVNPLGKVPCLVMEGREGITGAMFDSRVIVEYVDTLSPVGKLIPGTGRERVEVRTWEALADGLMDAAILARLEQTDESLNAFGKALELAPTYAPAWFGRARVLFNLGRHEEAIHDYRRYVAYGDPEDPHVQQVRDWLAGQP